MVFKLFVADGCEYEEVVVVIVDVIVVSVVVVLLVDVVVVNFSVVDVAL